MIQYTKAINLILIGLDSNSRGVLRPKIPIYSKKGPKNKGRKCLK